MAELCESWLGAKTSRERNRILSELWLLVNTALTRYLRLHSRTYGFISSEDARDIASEKAMVFLRSLEGDGPDATEVQPARICAYLSTLARNGLVDTLRRQQRHRTLEQGIATEARVRSSASESAEIIVQHTQFVDALSACLRSMTPRARAAWFLRVFLDMPSKRIATHPDVQMTPTGVDMLLSRTRRTLREGMKARGFDAEDTPPGVFVVLWDLFKHDTGDAQRSDEPS
ncbi:MAG TPA: sigma-70 family RNA polymerase sigma factor [Candidatus Krumholzibacteria bacterium]|nr:sigma-70 family RNA polymerase sigma factor [Candidatus Krumholzibacteria bacterium]